MGDDVVDQVRRRLFLAPRAARRAKAAPLATEGDELVVAAVAAVQSQEAVREDAALRERGELVVHELRQVGPGGRLGLGDEGRGVLLHQTGPPPAVRSWPAPAPVSPALRRNGRCGSVGAGC